MGIFGYFAFLDAVFDSSSNVIFNCKTKIGSSAFKDCKFLSSVKIPSTVHTISSEAFKNCLALESIEIPGSVTYIGYCAFNECKALKSLIIL